MAKYTYYKYEIEYSAWSEENTSIWEWDVPGQIRIENWPVEGWGIVTWDGSRYVGSIWGAWRPIYENLYPGDTYSYYRTAYYNEVSRDGTWVYYTKDSVRHYRSRDMGPGAYLGSVIADDGTYPDNGSWGGYWWVKQSKVFPDLWVNIGGVNKETDAGWVNIGGAWKEIEQMWCNIGGVWKEA